MKAVILAAGAGTRLQPLTDNTPKCLVEVQGKPLLQYELEALDRAGVRHCVLVVGYLSEQVQRQFGHKFGNVQLSYVINERFQETNNLYSLWLAREHLDADVLLLEGDLLFEEELLADLRGTSHPDVAVVDKFQDFMNGTAILAKGNLTASMLLKADQSAEFRYQDALKTVNIYKLCRHTIRTQVLPSLDEFVASGQNDQFYEAVFAQLIRRGQLQLAVHFTGPRQWIEIDTIEDLHEAERLFRRVSGSKAVSAIAAGVKSPLREQ